MRARPKRRQSWPSRTRSREHSHHHTRPLAMPATAPPSPPKSVLTTSSASVPIAIPPATLSVSVQASLPVPPVPVSVAASLPRSSHPCPALRLDVLAPHCCHPLLVCSLLNQLICCDVALFVRLFVRSFKASVTRGGRASRLLHAAGAAKDRDTPRPPRGQRPKLPPMVAPIHRTCLFLVGAHIDQNRARWATSLRRWRTPWWPPPSGLATPRASVHRPASKSLCRRKKSKSQQAPQRIPQVQRLLLLQRRRI